MNNNINYFDELDDFDWGEHLNNIYEEAIKKTYIDEFIDLSIKVDYKTRKIIPQKYVNTDFTSNYTEEYLSDNKKYTIELNFNIINDKDREIYRNTLSLNIIDNTNTNERTKLRPISFLTIHYSEYVLTPELNSYSISPSEDSKFIKAIKVDHEFLNDFIDRGVDDVKYSKPHLVAYIRKFLEKYINKI